LFPTKYENPIVKEARRLRWTLALNAILHIMLVVFCFYQAKWAVGACQFISLYGLYYFFMTLNGWPLAGYFLTQLVWIGLFTMSAGG